MYYKTKAQEIFNRHSNEIKEIQAALDLQKKLDCVTWLAGKNQWPVSIMGQKHEG